MKQNTLLILIAIISIVLVLICDFIFINDIERVPFGYELGRVVSNLSLAYLSSCIFYVVVVILKENRDKKNILKSVFHLTDDLIDHGYSVYTELAEVNGMKLEDYKKETISEEDFYELCDSCDPKHVFKNKFFGSFSKRRYATLANFIHNGAVYNVEKKINKIFEFMPFLDSEFIALLNKLRNSLFFKREANLLIVIAEEGNLPNQKIPKLKSMYEYLTIVREIENYNKTHFAKFK